MSSSATITPRVPAYQTVVTNHLMPWGAAWRNFSSRSSGDESARTMRLPTTTMTRASPSLRASDARLRVEPSPAGAKTMARHRRLDR